IKRHTDVSNDDLLGTMNLATGLLEFQKPIEKVWVSYKGKMIRVHNTRMDALVTPNHRMWLAPCGSKHPEFSMIPAGCLGALAPLAHRLAISAPQGWSGQELQSITIPKSVGAGYKSAKNRCFDADTFLRFLGFFVSEGSTDKYRSVVHLHQKPGP